MGNPRLRLWCLFLLSSADYAGLAPISRSRFHRLFFLANSIAGYYQTESYVQLVYKWKHGPFYPDAQWELTRLIGTGLAQLDSFRLVSQAPDKWDLEKVSLSSSAVAHLRLFRSLDYWKRVETLQRETAIALAHIEDKKIDTALKNNDIYRQTGATVLRFKRHNENIEKLDDILAAVQPEEQQPTKLDILRIYSRLMDLRATA